MRRIFKAAISLTAATAVAITLGGASLPAVAAVKDVTVTSNSVTAVPPRIDAPEVGSLRVTSRELPANVQPIRDFVQEGGLLGPQASAEAASAAAVRAADAAKAAAAAAAARAAAERAAEQAAIHTASTSGHVVNVWTSGFQTQINECRGGVDLSAAYHTATVGEHWECGGAAFPETPGAIVTFTGLDAGVYKVIGLVATLDAYTAHTSNIPHGYQMLFQTCRNNNSATTIFIALERI